MDCLSLDPLADDPAIMGHASMATGRTRSILGSVGKRANAPDTGGMLAGKLNGLAVALGARPIGGNMTLQGRTARMLDPVWWIRNLRRETIRQNETVQHALGVVSYRNQVYVTNHASQRKAERRHKNQRTLEGLEVVNEHGEARNLAEVAAGSVSNPKNRRGELMTRARGFEETADFHGHGGTFLTLTTPSRFHRVNWSGTQNKKWQDATPKDGQKHLCTTWARIRSEWAREGITAYGFRVAEPHHDGTPHWHILLFCEAGKLDQLEAIARRHALKDNPTEAGAQKRRFTAKRIDSAAGTATGYIAKYICKNIDGMHQDGSAMDRDFESGKAATSAAARVRDWASTWSIRQFQQIGGPSVTVWRELRRLGEKAETLQLELFEKPRAAASRGAWFDFWMLQGGPDVARKQLTLKPLSMADGLGKYGDEQKRVRGVLGTDSDGIEYDQITRLDTWTIQRAGLAAVDYHHAEFTDYLNRQKAIDKFVKEAGFLDVSDFRASSAGEAGTPRTRINNCTDGKKPPPEKFDFSAFNSEPEPFPIEGLYIPLKNRMQGTPEQQNEVIFESFAEVKRMKHAYDHAPH